jgi:hypothetical protein
MARSNDLVPAAKLVYGRLTRYAGKNGSCWPAVATLAEEVALKERMTQKHLNTLEAKGYLRKERRFNRFGGQESNSYVFLWHRIFDEWEDELIRRGVNSSAPSPVNHTSSRPVNRNAPKESHSEESHSKEGQFEGGDGLEGELDPVHSGSPKESQGDPVNFGELGFYSDSLTKTQLLAAERKKLLKAARDAVRVLPP